MEKSLPELVDPMSLQLILITNRDKSAIFYDHEIKTKCKIMSKLFIPRLPSLNHERLRFLSGSYSDPLPTFVVTRSFLLHAIRETKMAGILSGTRQICSTTMKMFIKCIFDEPFKLKSFLANWRQHDVILKWKLHLFERQIWPKTRSNECSCCRLCLLFCVLNIQRGNQSSLIWTWLLNGKEK